MRNPKRLLNSLLCLSFAALVSGCSQTSLVEVEGEAFLVRGTNIVRQPGLVVHFLSNSQATRLKALLDENEKKEEAIKAENEKKASAKVDSGANKFLQLYRKSNPDDLRSNGDLVLEFGAQRPELLKQPDFKKDWDEIQTRFDDAIAWEERSLKFEKMRDEFLKNERSVTTDSEGKFKVKLPEKGVIVYSSSAGRTWNFGFIPSGQKLILSDANSR